MERLNVNDETQLRKIWEAHADQVLNLAYRVLGDEQAAQDVLQDVFLELPQSMAGFRGESSLGTWIYKKAWNQSLMKFRSTKNHLRLEDLHMSDIAESMGLDQHQSSPEDDLSTSQMKAQVHAALDTLDVETRSMLWLKEAEGVEITNLSEIFKKPEGTIKARLHRARQKLRDILHREMEYGR